MMGQPNTDKAGDDVKVSGFATCIASKEYVTYTDEFFKRIMAGIIIKGKQ